MAAVDSAGTKMLNLVYTVNTKMFRHPKYYKELRKLRNKLDQVISSEAGDGERERAPDPGLKPQASSPKPQASSAKLTKQQAASVKPRGTSVKLQAASVKLQDS